MDREIQTRPAVAVRIRSRVVLFAFFGVKHLRLQASKSPENLDSSVTVSLRS
jgi:hypothetical protein